MKNNQLNLIFYNFFSGGGRDLQTAVTYAKNSSIKKQAHSNNNSLLISNQPGANSVNRLNNNMPKKTTTSSSGKIFFNQISNTKSNALIKSLYNLLTFICNATTNSVQNNKLLLKL